MDDVTRLALLPSDGEATDGSTPRRQPQEEEDLAQVVTSN